MLPDSFSKIFSEIEAALRDGVILRYGVGGAIGALVYIEAVATEDVDVFIAVDPSARSVLDPFRAVYDYFLGRGARWEGEHLVIGGWPVHFLPSTGPLMDDALANTRRTAVDDLVISVLSLEHLAAVALETNRGKDRARLEQIWTSGELDRERFLALVQRFGLSERWEKVREFFEERE